MSISVDFKDTVAEKKVRRIRIMLKDSLLIDPTFKEFDEMYNFAFNNMDGLLEDFDGDELEFNKNNWSEDYMNELKVELMGNFSERRINHLKEVCSYLYKDKAKIIETQRIAKSSSPEYNTQANIAKGAIVGGVAIAAVGIAISKTAVIVAGTVVAATGGVLLATKNSNR